MRPIRDNAQETIDVFGDVLAFARQRGVTLTTVSGLLSAVNAAVASAPGVDKLARGH